MFRNLRNAEPSVRCFLQYDRLYVENEVYLYNEVEQRVERMLINRMTVDGSLVTPRPKSQGPGQGGRSSRLKRRSESRAGDVSQVHSHSNGKHKEEALTELESEIIQTGIFEKIFIESKS